MYIAAKAQYNAESTNCCTRPYPEDLMRLNRIADGRIRLHRPGLMRTQGASAGKASRNLGPRLQLPRSRTWLSKTGLMSQCSSSLAKAVPGVAAAVTGVADGAGKPPLMVAEYGDEAGMDDVAESGSECETECREGCSREAGSRQSRAS